MAEQQRDRAPARKILVIDDDPAVVATLADGLHLVRGYDVVVAGEGASGLERFFVERPDCVVVDVRMPGLNGYQFLRALRGDSATAQTPIIVLSALVQEQEQLAGLLSGADLYLLKPVEMGDLLAAIDEAIGRSAAQRAEQIEFLSTDDETKRGVP